MTNGFARKSHRVALSIAWAGSSWVTATYAQDNLQKDASAAAAADGGAFLPWSVQADHGPQRASVQVTSGYDTAADSAQVRGEANVGLIGPVGLRVGAAYDGLGESTRPFIGGWADVLEQDRAGVDLSVHARFESDGFNTVPEVAAGIALARSFGDSAVLLNVEYGQGIDDSERNGAVSLAALQRLSDWLRVGLDSRFQIDLERDLDEPTDEPDWRFQGGPVGLATFGAFSVTAGAGLAGLRYRLSPVNHFGAVVYAGFGGAL